MPDAHKPSSEEVVSSKQSSSNMILVLNAGSSSIKYALFDASHQPLPRDAEWHGEVDDIGQKDGPDDYHDALHSIRERVSKQLGNRTLSAVAHRVVHGGNKYFEPTRISKHVLSDLRSYIPLAPLHQPFALDAIEAFLHSSPDLPQIACFDTGFHNTMPDVEKMLPLPYDAWEQGLRRFGFHGLSYEYQSIALAERYPAALSRGRVVVAHLGNGASLCGMLDGKSMTTTMGFSALDGLMMGTRCGSLDAGALIYLMEVKKLSLEAVGDLLYHKSGLLGVSGISSDPRVLLEQAPHSPRAASALALYARRFVHELGACVAALGGIDMLVFTAGIGEHSAAMRERLCAPLAFMGIELDPAANADHEAGARLISVSHDNRGTSQLFGSRAVAIAVEPTNEEWVAARHAQTLLAS